MKEALLTILALGGLVAWPLAVVCRRAGFPTWLAILLAGTALVCPPLPLWFFALARWPVGDKVRRLERPRSAAVAPSSPARELGRSTGQTQGG